MPPAHPRAVPPTDGDLVVHDLGSAPPGPLSDDAVLALLGVEPDDLAVYRLLLSGAAQADVAGLATRADLAVDQVSTGLDRLRRCGFVAGDQVVPPGNALRALVHQRRAEVHETEAALERTAGRLDQLVADLVGQVPEALAGRHGSVELLTGAEAVGRFANELFDTATTELLVFNAPPYAQLSTPQYAGQVDDDPVVPLLPTQDPTGRALLRGVHVRHVFAQDGIDVPRRFSQLPAYVALGLEVRVRPSALPTKLIVADRCTALLPPTDVADPTASGLVLRDGLLMNVLVPLFEEVWGAALPVGLASDDPAAGPSEDERVLIGLLAGGLKDEAIARQLDVHVHTARRRITALLARLGAETRFQAGIQAARRGWLG